MATEKLPPEPSMDEILASIRQLMADESKSQKTPPRREGNEDILDLTCLLPDEASSAKKDKEQKVSLPHDHKRPFSLLGEKVKSSTPPEHKNEPSQASRSGSGSDELLLSPSTASETAQAFHTLTHLAQEKKSVSHHALSEEMSSRVIENQLREILRPLLKEWLDANLPLLVRWVVNEQVEKIMRQGDGDSFETKREK